MNKKITGLCRFFIIFGLAFIILYPVIYMFSCSFRDSIDMNDPSVMWIPKHFTFDVIAETAEVMELPETLLNTFLLNIGCSVVQVIACAFTGYGFARFDFFGRKFFFGIVIMMIIVPPQIISLPLYSNFVHLGLINSKLSMYLPALMGNGIRSGFMIFIFCQFFKGLPKEIEDSAYIDGCGRFRAFLSIMLPNAKSALLTVFLFSVVFYWNDYYISSLFFTDNHSHEELLLIPNNVPERQLWPAHSLPARFAGKSAHQLLPPQTPYPHYSVPQLSLHFPLLLPMNFHSSEHAR